MIWIWCVSLRSNVDGVIGVRACRLFIDIIAHNVCIAKVTIMLLLWRRRMLLRRLCSVWLRGGDASSDNGCSTIVRFTIMWLHSIGVFMRGHTIVGHILVVMMLNHSLRRHTRRTIFTRFLVSVLRRSRWRVHFIGADVVATDDISTARAGHFFFLFIRILPMWVDIVAFVIDAVTIAMALPLPLYEIQQTILAALMLLLLFSDSDRCLRRWLRRYANWLRHGIECNRLVCWTFYWSTWIWLRYSLLGRCHFIVADSVQSI